MRIWANSVVAEAHEMELEIYIEGGADNEALNTHAYHGTQVDSVSANFAASDVIYWKVTDAAVTALQAGDNFFCEVLHEAAEGDNCATDACFTVVEVGYI